MGLFDKAKEALSGEQGEELRNKAQDLATQLDDKAEELSTKEGTVGDVATKAHGLLDRVDRD